MRMTCDYVFRDDLIADLLLSIIVKILQIAPPYTFNVSENKYNTMCRRIRPVLCELFGTTMNELSQCTGFYANLYTCCRCILALMS